MGLDWFFTSRSKVTVYCWKRLRRHPPLSWTRCRGTRLKSCGYCTQPKNGWSAEDWRLYFEERAAIAEFDGGLPRAKAEAQAFECCVVTWLDRNPAPSAPGRCAWCGRSESHAPVVPFGTEPGTHTWLHRECWSAWRKMRPFHAKEALTRMGIGDLSGGCIASGGCSHPSNEHQQQ